MLRASTASPRAGFAKSALSLLAALLAFGPAPRASVIEAFEDSVAALYETKASATVRVKIAVATTSENGREGAALNVFSGFFISEDGKILTNAVPLQKDARVWIERGGAPYLCEILGADARSNIGLLRAVKLPPNFEYIPIGDARPPRVGSFAFAVTHPLDLKPTPKLGLVAGFESRFATQDFPFTYIRIGLPIGAGEGGSPFFHANGNLMGIGVAAVPDLGASYIVPIKALQRIVQDLEAGGGIRYGEIPLAFAEKADPKDGKLRVVVDSIQSDSLAASAGVKVGDVLLSMDGVEMDSVNDARDFVFFKDAGSFLLLRVRRGDQELEFPLLCRPLDLEPARP